MTIVNLTLSSDNHQFIENHSVTIVNLILFSDNRQFIKHHSVTIVNLTLFTDNRQFDTLKLWPLGPLRAGLTVGTVVLSYTLCGVAVPPSLSHPPLGGGRGMGAWLNNRPCGSHTNCENFGKIFEFCVITLEILTATWWLAKPARLALPT